MELVRDDARTTGRTETDGGPTFLNDFDDGFGADRELAERRLSTSVPRPAIDWLNGVSATTADLFHNLPSAPSHDPSLATLPKLKTHFSHSPLLRGSNDGHAFAVEGGGDGGDAEPLEELDDRDEVELMAEEHNVSPSSSLKHGVVSTSLASLVKPAEQMDLGELITATEKACIRLLDNVNEDLQMKGKNVDRDQSNAFQSSEQESSMADDKHLLGLLTELRQCLRQCKLDVPGSSKARDSEDNSPLSAESAESRQRRSISMQGEARLCLDVSPNRAVELRNPFATDKDTDLLRSPNDDRDRESFAATAQLSGLIDETCKRLRQGTLMGIGEEQAGTLLSRLHASDLIVRERLLNLSSNTKASKQRSSISSPRSSSFSMASQRSSRAASPAMNETVGDPVGEAVVAGFGAGVTQSLSRVSMQSRRSSIAFLPNATTTLDRRSSVRSGGGHEVGGHRSVHSPPPRYSLESTRSWASNVFPPLSGADTDQASSVHHHPVETDKIRRLSAASDNTFGVHGSLTHPPAYVSEKQHKSWSDRKASSSSSLVALSDTTKVGLRYMHGSTDKSFKHTRSRSDLLSRLSHEQANPGDLNLVQRSLDRFYSATPQLTDQRARKSESTRRLSQRDEDFTIMIDRIARLDRLDDQRAASPRLQMRDRAAGQVNQDTARSSAPPTASTSRQESAPRTRRLASMGSISFAPLRRASLLWTGSSKGKEKEANFGSERNDTSTRRSSAMEQHVRLDPQNGVERPDIVAGKQSTNQDVHSMSKLEKMGLPAVSRDSTGCTEKAYLTHSRRQSQNHNDVDDILDIITSTARMKRMPNQDAVRRPKGTGSASKESVVETSGQKQKDDRGKSGGEAKAMTHTDIIDNDRRREDSQADVKAGQSRSAGGLRCLVETQDRLGVMLTMVWQNCSSSATSMHWKVSQDGQSPALSRMNVEIDDQACSFTLPARTNTAEQSVLRDGDKWVVRLPLDDSTGATTTTAPLAVPYAASDLEQMNTGRWSCVECGEVVADLSATKRYLPLPSQHWEELVDAWMCHDDQELNQTLVKAQDGLQRHVGLQDGQVHVSDRHIVVSMSMVDLESVDIQEAVKCKTCLATLGHANAKEGAVLFLKMAIRPTDPNVQAPPLSAFVAHDIVLNANAHATRRFVIERDGEEQSAEVLIVWLFVESCRMSVWPKDGGLNTALNKNSVRSTTISASKVMYQRRRLENDVDHARLLESNSSNWTGPAMHDRLSYPKRIVSRLLSILEASNECYPPSQRTFVTPGGIDGHESWNVAFLPYTW